MRKRKICHLTSVHPLFDIRIYHKECQSLVHNGFDVTLIAPYEKSNDSGNIDTIYINLPKPRIKRFLVVNQKMLKLALKTKAELYHFHDPELMPCGVFLRFFGKKVIFDIHENVRKSLKSKDWLPFGSRSLIIFLYFLLERFCILFYHKLILAEESYLKYYPEKKSKVVLNYPLKTEINEVIKELRSPYRFVYVGVVHQLKGIWQMLEAIHSLNKQGFDSRLDLIGELRPNSLEGEILNFLTKNNLNDKVILHGRKEFKEVKSFIKNSHLGFSILQPIPNYVESLPTKIFEYMQHGLPVITNDFPLYSKYVEDNNVGICVDYYDIDSIVNKIITLFDDNNYYQMSRNGIDLTSNIINWDSQEKILIETYNELLNK